MQRHAETKSTLLTRLVVATRCGWAGLFFTLSVLVQQAEIIAQENDRQILNDALVTGRFSWMASRPLVEPHNHNGDHCYSVKDPSVVQHNGRWHLFCTIRSKQNTHQIEYRSFSDWADASGAQPQLLDMTSGYCCAPQVFYFAPQKKWYLIYQVQDSSRSPSLQPAFSSTDNLDDPKSWSKPTLLFSKQPAAVKMWIDFWVICDQRKAHLFFTSHAGWMWRSETSLNDFPFGWSKPEVVLRGDIFEASHIYRLKGQDKFLTLVEAQEGRRRYLKAFTADRLDGKWSPLALPDRSRLHRWGIRKGCRTLYRKDHPGRRHLEQSNRWLVLNCFGCSAESVNYPPSQTLPQSKTNRAAT